MIPSLKFMVTVDVIDVFRPSEQISSIIRDCIEKKPKVIWLQEGIHDFESEELARKAGIIVVFNRCMLAEHHEIITMTVFDRFSS